MDVKVTGRDLVTMEHETRGLYAGVNAHVHPFVVGVWGGLGPESAAFLRTIGARFRDRVALSVLLVRGNAWVAHQYERLARV